MSDRPDATQTLPPIRVRTYFGQTQGQAAQQFEADASLAASAGYVPVSQAWEGTTLTVTYQVQASLGPQPASQPGPSQVMRVRQEGDEIGWSVGQGIGSGMGCLLCAIGRFVLLAILARLGGHGAQWCRLDVRAELRESTMRALATATPGEQLRLVRGPQSGCGDPGLLEAEEQGIEFAPVDALRGGEFSWPQVGTSLGH